MPWLRQPCCVTRCGHSATSPGRPALGCWRGSAARPGSCRDPRGRAGPRRCRQGHHLGHRHQPRASVSNQQHRHRIAGHCVHLGRRDLHDPRRRADRPHAPYPITGREHPVMGGCHAFRWRGAVLPLADRLPRRSRCGDRHHRPNGRLVDRGFLSGAGPGSNVRLHPRRRVWSASLLAAEWPTG